MLKQPYNMTRYHDIMQETRSVEEHNVVAKFPSHSKLNG